MKFWFKFKFGKDRQNTLNSTNKISISIESKNRIGFFYYYTHFIFSLLYFFLLFINFFISRSLTMVFVNSCCRYLATGSSFKTLGYSFRISDVTVGRIVKEICEAIWDNLHALHIPFPKEDEVEPIVQEFWNKWKFPNCVGCIDGKHLRIKNPRHSGSLYRNYKQFFSIVLQAVAGPDYRFIAIHVGAYGKESDGGIFRIPAFPRNLKRERWVLGASPLFQEQTLWYLTFF